jgi:peptidoglycan/xylan/chitin deacetylase (PgdA/CDA1 family)
VTTILCYHSVDAGWQSPLAIPNRTFAEQAAWLARSARVHSLERALEIADASGRLPRGSTALTFDDGYGGMVRHALPELARLGLPATLFVVTGALDGSVRPEDWIRPGDLAGTSPDVVGLGDVQALAAAGWTFGSHSHTHRDLTELSEQECFDDLRASRTVLEDAIGRAVNWIAYPGGRHAPHVRRAARRAGFGYGLGLPETRERPERMAIPRVGIYRGDGVRSLRAKLSPWYLPFRTSPAFPVAQRVVRAARRVAHR